MTAEVLEPGEYRYQIVEDGQPTYSGVAMVEQLQTRDVVAGWVLDRSRQTVSVSDSATVELTAAPVYDEVPW